MQENDITKVFRVISTAILLLALSIHISTFLFKRYLPIYDVSMIIHFLSFIPFTIMIVSIRKNTRSSEHLLFMRDILPKIGSFWIITAILFFTYALCNFFYNSSIVTGNPIIEKGKYFLFNHGAFSEISESQYHKYKFIELRMFSGHWMIFSIIPLIYFKTLGVIKRQTQDLT